MALDSEEVIRVRAYHLWEAHGRPEGRDLEFWEQARQLHATIEQGTQPVQKRARGAARARSAASGSRKGRAS